MAALEGFLTGVAMIIFIGPVLFTLLKASLAYGFRGGMAVATGIIVSDILAVAVCYLGAIPFFSSSDNQLWLALSGGVILVVLGVKYLTGTHQSRQGEVKLHVKDLGSLFGKGFMVNFVNPFVFIVWIGLIGYAEQRYEQEILIYLTMVLVGIFLTDSLKAFFADKLRPLLSEGPLKRVYKVLGVLMILFSFRLFYEAYILLG